MRLTRDICLPWTLIAIGVALRFIDLGVPDFATDEAQASLGATAAWTPAGMLVLQSAQAIFGHTILVARGTSAVFGAALLPVIFATARLYGDRRFALMATALAAIFPSHILFSRLAYLSAQLAFAWALTLLAFLKARRQYVMLSSAGTPPSIRSSLCSELLRMTCRRVSKHRWLLTLFCASVYASLIKTQASLFPFALLCGRIIEERKNAPRDDIVWTIVLSLIPAAAHIATHPGIAATLLLYGGNMYGVSGILGRAGTLIVTWWQVLLLFLPASLLALPSLRSFEWPLSVFLLLAVAMGFLLGPDHTYYATELVLFALPIGLALRHLRPILQESCMVLLLATTLALLGPRDWLQNRWTLDLYREEGYWNTHAEAINAALQREDAVTVLGFAGHHLRWYLEPTVLVGRNREPPYPTEYLLVLQDRYLARTMGTVTYDDGNVTIVRQAP